MLERKGTIALILGGFSYFLSDYLTWSTLIFVFFSVCTLAVGIKIPKPLRIISALVIVASYILVYGKIFDPEVGLNFLTSVVMLKVLESETDRDGYMVFFGLILLIAAGSIFEKSLEYTFFLFGGFSLLLASFHQGREIRWVKKEIVLTFILLIPLIAVLFFVVPRIVSPISLFRPQNQKGKIGYTKTVNMDEIESLTPSDEIAFYAVITGIVPRNELYWRGNVLTLTDGWNWIESSKTDGIHLRDEAFVFKGLKQEIYLSHSSEYFFMLDWPLTLRTELGDKRIGQTGTLSQKRTTKSYTVWSQKTSTKKIVGGVKSLTISGLKSQDKEWIKENFKAEGVSDLLEEIQAFFRKENFAYTLSPGKVQSFSAFMEGKKGFCTHFASATAQILRTKGVPARLISGYMGGLYNQLGEYYQITENDAHVWVEIESNGRWTRIDPTEWISPERVSLGGDAFIKDIEQSDNLNFKNMNFFRHFGFLQDLRMEIERLNFVYYRLLEEMNYFSQLTLLRKLGLDKKFVFIIIPVLVLVFSALYLLMIKFYRRDKDLEMMAWRRLHKKLDSPSEGKLISIHQLESKIAKLDHAKKESAQKILKSLIGHSYQDVDISLKQVIKDIQKL